MVEGLNIIYTQPSFSDFFELGCIIPDVLMHELGHNVICLSTGWHMGDFVGKMVEGKPMVMKNHKDGIFNRWMGDITNKLLRNISQMENIDLFFSFIGDRIHLGVINRVREAGIKTLNWDEIDPSADYRINHLLRYKKYPLFHSPTFWEKQRVYDAVFGAYRFIPNWMPLAAYSELFVPEPKGRDVNIAFVGNIDNILRKPWLVKFERFGITMRSNDMRYPDIKKLYSSAKIVINQHQNGTCNGRVFEATANGALLITDYAPGLEECFEIDKEVVLSKTDGVAEVEYFLENDDEREKIAKAGLERTIKDHQFKDRLEEMIKRTMEGDVWTWKRK